MKLEVGNREAVDQALTDSAHLKYRPDVDGLRAVAVLSVVAYHAFPAWAAGGLVGVDIFFVISGFLISTIILKGLSQDRFSYLDFYARRIRRIFPALMLVLAGCLAFGWFALYDSEYKPLGKHVAGGAGFVANFVLWRESGYFDAQAAFKQLLHLWSLGIEEQFYLLWPLMLALLWKKTHAMLPLISIVLVASWGLNMWLVSIQPSTTFYLPATRFWELMIGALLAYMTQSTASVAALVPASLRRAFKTSFRFRAAMAEASACCGAALLFIAMAVINRGSLFPGWLALLPTAGAFLIIAAGPAATINRRLLSARPVVFIGLISYPLYLWHWPLLSFDTLLSSDLPTRANRALVVVASFVLAWLTYRFVEKPVRSSRHPATVFALCAIAAVIACVGLMVYRSEGFPARAFNERNGSGRTLLAASASLDTELRDSTFKAGRCDALAISDAAKKFCAIYGPSNGSTVVVWGDSHAWAWAPVFYKIAKEKNLRMIVFSVGACPPLVETRRIDPDAKYTSCFSFGAAEPFVEAIKTLQPRRIFLVSFWSLYTRPGAIEAEHADKADYESSSVFEAQLTKTVHALPPDVPVTIFRTAPVLLNDLSRGLLRHVRIEPTVEEHDTREAEANRAIAATSSRSPNVSVFDPTALQCAQTCKAVIDGTLMYFDWGHISAQGALLYRDEIAKGYFSDIAR